MYIPLYNFFYELIEIHEFYATESLRLRHASGPWTPRTTRCIPIADPDLLYNFFHLVLRVQIPEARSESRLCMSRLGNASVNG
jgi:hypothetical protein